jgi:hypothetical protein
VSHTHGKFKISKGYDPSVRIPEVLLKCVGFIGEVSQRVGDEVFGDLHATGFFVAVPCKNPRLPGHFVYFVTAKHVAHDLKDSETYFLVNKRGGGLLKLRPHVDSPWCLHPSDDAADVAILSVEIDPRAEIIAIPVKEFISAKDFKTEAGVEGKFGIGDETVTVGLFTEAPGVTRNCPIVRHGNLAMLPIEQIQTELGYADVYLVEARSIGGLSGSPVWIRPSLLMLAQEEEQVVPTGIVGPGRFLGLMHGHWAIKESEINDPRIVHDKQRGVNLGIAIVVPASKILETINQSGLMELREKTEEAALKRSMPQMDSASTTRPISQETETGLEIAVPTRDEFSDALNKSTRKIAPRD